MDWTSLQEIPAWLWLATAILSLLELGLMIWALVDLVRREHVRGAIKVIWIVVIVFINFIGPILYFIMGRPEKPIEEERYGQ